MDKTNDRGVCLPRASAFSPTLRIVAWSDTSSIRKKLMYGSETHLTDHLKNSSSPADRCNTPNNQCTRSLPADTTNNRHSHDISSTKSLRVRPQTIPYRSKSGTISGRPCSAPPDHAKNHTAKKHAAKKHAAMYQNKAPPSSGVPLSTLNLALPENVPAAKPANAFQPKLPPKKKFPAWYNPECPNRPAPLSTSPGVSVTWNITVTKIEQERTNQDRTKNVFFFDFLLHSSIFLLEIFSIALQLRCKAGAGAHAIRGDT